MNIDPNIDPDKSNNDSLKTKTTKIKHESQGSKNGAWNELKKEQITAFLLLIILSTSFGFAGGYFGEQTSKNEAVKTEIQRQTVNNEGELIAQIAREVGPSVVSVNVTSQGQQSSFFGSRSVLQASAGTGIIIDSSGIILTNRHVIPDGTTSVNIVLSDGTEYENVEVIGKTSQSDSLDVAFLKINDTKGKQLTAAKLGDSSKVEVGQRVVAIGNALGQFENTVTAGIISGYGRSVEAGDENSSETLQNLFQTDAAINEGNSGGPLVNSSGEVIGINTAVAGSGENIGFAIPINDVQGLINSVKKEGKLLRPYIGVRYVALNDNYAAQNNLSVKRGAYIVPSTDGQASIISGSPAAQAGLKEGDVITKVNDITIDEDNSLISVLGRFSVGEKVTLTIVREGSEQKTDLTLQAAPLN